MEKIIWTDPAKISLLHIWEFYAEVNPGLADKIVDEILKGMTGLIFLEQYQLEEGLKLSKDNCETF